MENHVGVETRSTARCQVLGVRWRDLGFGVRDWGLGGRWLLSSFGCELSAPKKWKIPACANCGRAHNDARPLEMLKMKEPPGMCIKTKAMVTKCPAKNKTFARKCTNCAIIDNNRLDFLTENARICHKSGRNNADLTPGDPSGIF